MAGDIAHVDRHTAVETDEIHSPPPTVRCNGTYSWASFAYKRSDQDRLRQCLALPSDAPKQLIDDGLNDIVDGIDIYHQAFMAKVGRDDDAPKGMLRMANQACTRYVNAILADLWSSPPRSRAELMTRLMVNEALAIGRKATSGALDRLDGCRNGIPALHGASLAFKVAKQGLDLLAQFEGRASANMTVNVQGHAIVQQNNG